MFVSIFRRSEKTMKRKLFGYMLLLAAVIIAVFMISLFLLGRFDSIEKHTYESLDVQMEVFKKDITSHFDRLATSGVQLSEDTTSVIENYFKENSLGFSDLSDSDEHISGIQEKMIEPLRQMLLRNDCSGAFIMLDATINTSLPDSDTSRSGIYLQLNGYEESKSEILLYRGLSGIGKNHSIIPHRKWNLEFCTDLFSNYDFTLASKELPIEKAYGITELTDLPGTSEKAFLITFPIKGSDGSFYGICGFEISSSYYKTFHAQPTKIDRLLCVFAKSDDSSVKVSNGLLCGAAEGTYPLSPVKELTVRKAGGGLSVFEENRLSYIGLEEKVTLSPQKNEYSLAVMFPKRDYDSLVRQNFIKSLVLWLFILVFAISVCLYFSRRYLSPILRDLDQLKTKKRELLRSDTAEINGLFAFIAEQDREHEAELHKLVLESDAAKNEAERLKAEYEKAKAKHEAAQTEIARLAYSRKTEVDPDDYQNFLAGLKTLTAKERQIFDYYLEGKTVKEIVTLADVKECTVRFHNQNIYSKLGVNSLKQLLRFAALMKQDEKNRADE